MGIVSDHYAPVSAMRPGDLLWWNSQVGTAVVLWVSYLRTDCRRQLGFLFQTGELHVQEFIEGSTIKLLKRAEDHDHGRQAEK